MEIRFPIIRPLYWLSQLFTWLSFIGKHRPSYHALGSLRYRAHYIGIALGWMSKGNQFDRRPLCERLAAGNYYWREAFTRGLWASSTPSRDRAVAPFGGILISIVAGVAIYSALAIAWLS